MRRTLGMTLLSLLVLVPVIVVIGAVDTGAPLPHAIVRKVPLFVWACWFLLSVWVALDGYRFVDLFARPISSFGREDLVVSFLGSLNVIAVTAAMYLAS